MRLPTIVPTINKPPTPITRRVPMRRISVPVPNDGANIPSTCHSMTKATLPKANKCASMARGVAVMRNTMTP